MKLMEERILAEATVLPGGILKVGTFLNHGIDTHLLTQSAAEIASMYADRPVNKILTIEASGIALAVATGMVMNVPVVFAKKHKTSNVDGPTYATSVHSFTHNTDYNVAVEAQLLSPDDCILLVDDFLALGNALKGLIRLVNQAGAELAGVAVAIEKRFQGGGDSLREQGIRVEALAAIEAMTDTELVFARDLTR